MGLAGLLDWWQRQAGVGPDHEPDHETDYGPDSPSDHRHEPPTRMPATGPGLELPQGSYGPDDWLDPWSASDTPGDAADSPENAVGEADRLRELLTRVLLDEALADGLEVRDGPA